MSRDRERSARRRGRAVRAALSRAARRESSSYASLMACMARSPKLADEVEDFALLRSDGMPTYHLASCVDDADLRISHIIRGQDHLTNTFKHLLIFEGEPGRRAAAVRASSPAGGARRDKAFEAQTWPGGQRNHVSRRGFSASGLCQLSVPAWAGRPRTIANFSPSTSSPRLSRWRASIAQMPS